MQPFTRKAETPVRLDQPHLSGDVRSQPEHAHYRWAAPGKSVKKTGGYLLEQPVFQNENAGAACILTHLAQQIADYLRRAGERGIELARILPASFGEVRPAAA
jgi:hypothetical protein